MTQEQVEAALDAGKVEIKRPQGDWVRARRHGPTIYVSPVNWRIPVRLENQVVGSITASDERYGFGFVRIVGQ